MVLRSVMCAAALLAVAGGPVCRVNPVGAVEPPTDRSTGPSNANEIAAALPPLEKIDGGVRIPLTNVEPMAWRPVHPTVKIEPVGGSLRVRYARKRGSAFGVALMLRPGSFAGCKSLRIRLSASPAQRPQICLTDTDGHVWTFPTSRVESDAAEISLPFDVLRPDPFQNAGRTLPARPDIAKMRMISILDLSGYMGGGEVPSQWVIESFEGVSR